MNNDTHVPLVDDSEIVTAVDGRDILEETIGLGDKFFPVGLRGRLGDVDGDHFVLGSVFVGPNVEKRSVVFDTVETRVSKGKLQLYS